MNVTFTIWSLEPLKIVLVHLSMHYRQYRQDHLICFFRRSHNVFTQTINVHAPFYALSQMWELVKRTLQIYHFTIHRVYICGLPSKNQHSAPLIVIIQWFTEVVKNSTMTLICRDDRLLWIWNFSVIPNRFYKPLNYHNQRCKLSWFWLGRSHIS